MQTVGLRGRTRARGIGLAVSALLAVMAGTLGTAHARPTPGMRCGATKARVSGRLLGDTLACHVKGRAKGRAASPACLDPAAGRFLSGFDDSACPGDAATVRSAVEACVVALTHDAVGTGKCPAAGLGALGTAARALGGCAAREALHPGKGAACTTHVAGRLDAALAKRAVCIAASARDDLVAGCWPAVLAALAGTSTTTATTTSIPPTSTSAAATTTTTAATTSTDLATTTITTTTGTTSTDVVSTTTTTTETTTTTAECATPADCPGSDTECATRTCAGGICGLSFQPAGTVVTDQELGDCRDTTCDGAGGFAHAANDADVPVDGNPCTDDVCVAGTPAHPAVAAGTPCSQLAPLVCDGAGSCVQCLAPADCPGVDTECSQRTCVANQCGVDFTAQGTPVSNQAAGDCHVLQCDGAGGVDNVVDDADADDQNECTLDSCDMGTATHSPLPDTTPCSSGECNGGSCCAVGQVCG